MSESSLAVQDAVLAAVTAAVDPTPVYAHVPQNTSAPYVLIGDDNATPDNTKSANGQEHSVEISVFSSQRSYAEVKQTTKKIYNALHRVPLYPSGTQRVIPQYDFSEFFRDPDGPRGVIRFRIQT
jgi:hypothetical protein